MRFGAIGARALLVCLSLVVPAWGEANQTSDPGAAGRAARDFQTGVEHFEAGQYEAAARAFLRADLAVPDSDTLTNALVAAQKSNEHLLVTRIAARALRAHQGDPGLVARSRKALAAAAVHLSLLRLSCSPTPCQLFLDGEPVQAGSAYAHPGTHRISATRQEPAGAAQMIREEEGNLVAGATYVFEIDLRPGALSEVRALSTGEVQTLGRKSEQSPPEPGQAWPHLDRAVFYGGVGVTSLLAIATTASGISALRASQEVPSEPSHEEVERVERQILRTDVLLAVTASAALFTVGWGLFATDFGDAGEMKVGLVLDQGLSVRARGRFW